MAQTIERSLNVAQAFFLYAGALYGRKNNAG